MSEADSFSCPGCSATYRRGALIEGQRVKCRKCGDVITVPGDELEALEELIEAPEQQPASARSAGAKRSAARGRSARRRPDQGDRSTKSPVMLFIGIGAMVVIAVGIWFLTSSNKTTVKQSDARAPSDTQSANAPPQKKASTDERIAGLVKEAEGSSDTNTAVAKLREAVELRKTAEASGDASPSEDDLWAKILKVDPDNKDARRRRSEVRYVGKDPDWKDKWVTTEKYREITAEWRRRETERTAALAKKKEAERWETPFGKKAKRAADWFRKDAAQVPDFDLKFYFESEDTPKPYLLMVEDVQSPAPDEVARDIGPGLAALREQFRRAYPGDTLPSWDDSDYVVPVMILADEKSYARFRDNGHNIFPSTEIVAAFYVSGVDSSISDVCKGALYVWRHTEKSEAQFYQSLFHEGTHQIMHNAAVGLGGLWEMPRAMPWMTEGIAEFWGSYEGNRHTGYKFRRLLDGRYPTVQRCAMAYNDWRPLHLKWVEGGKQGDPPSKRGFMTPKEFLAVSRLRFDQARRRQGDKRATQDDEFIVSSAYALGWAWIYYCHVGVREAKVGMTQSEFIRGFTRVLADELRHESSMKALEKAYDIESDEQWEAIAEDFFFFCQRTLHRIKQGALDVPDIPFPK